VEVDRGCVVRVMGAHVFRDEGGSAVQTALRKGRGLVNEEKKDEKTG